MDPDDRAAVEAFAAFLEDPRSRCAVCLSADHRRFSQCPKFTDEERRRVGVMVLDVAYARTIERVLKKRVKTAEVRGDLL